MSGPGKSGTKPQKRKKWLTSVKKAFIRCILGPEVKDDGYDEFARPFPGYHELSKGVCELPDIMLTDVHKIRTTSSLSVDVHSQFPTPEQIKERLMRAERYYLGNQNVHPSFSVINQPENEIVFEEEDPDYKLSRSTWRYILDRPLIEQYVLMSNYIRKLSTEAAINQVEDEKSIEEEESDSEGIFNNPHIKKATAKRSSRRMEKVEEKLLKSGFNSKAAAAGIMSNESSNTSFEPLSPPEDEDDESPPMRVTFKLPKKEENVVEFDIPSFTCFESTLMGVKRVKEVQLEKTELDTTDWNVGEQENISLGSVSIPSVGDQTPAQDKSKEVDEFYPNLDEMLKNDDVKIGENCSIVSNFEPPVELKNALSHVKRDSEDISISNTNEATSEQSPCEAKVFSDPIQSPILNSDIPDLDSDETSPTTEPNQISDPGKNETTDFQIFRKHGVASIPVSSISGGMPKSFSKDLPNSPSKATRSYSDPIVLSKHETSSQKTKLKKVTSSEVQGFVGKTTDFLTFRNDSESENNIKDTEEVLKPSISSTSSKTNIKAGKKLSDPTLAPKIDTDLSAETLLEVPPRTVLKQSSSGNIPRITGKTTDFLTFRNYTVSNIPVKDIIEDVPEHKREEVKAKLQQPPTEKKKKQRKYSRPFELNPLETCIDWTEETPATVTVTQCENELQHPTAFRITADTSNLTSDTPLQVSKDPSKPFKHVRSWLNDPTQNDAEAAPFGSKDFSMKSDAARVSKPSKDKKSDSSGIISKPKSKTKSILTPIFRPLSPNSKNPENE